MYLLQYVNRYKSNINTINTYVVLIQFREISDRSSPSLFRYDSRTLLMRVTTFCHHSMYVLQVPAESIAVWVRVARLVLAQTYQNGKNTPSDHSIHKTAIYYTKRP
jgi:hypothetical protein